MRGVKNSALQYTYRFKSGKHYSIFHIDSTLILFLFFGLISFIDYICWYNRVPIMQSLMKEAKNSVNNPNMI